MVWSIDVPFHCLRKEFCKTCMCHRGHCIKGMDADMDPRVLRQALTVDVWMIADSVPSGVRASASLEGVAPGTTWYIILPLGTP